MTQQINFPQSQIVDNHGNLSLEWREWLLNPQTLTAKFSIALGVSSGGTGSSAVPTNGQILIGNGTSYATASLGAGTGLTVTPGAGTLSVGITNTAVTAGTYGSAAKSVTYTVNAQGQLTSSAEQSIAIDTSQLTSGYLAAARFPALTGDVTTVAGSLGTTLATVNANVGSFGSASKSISITVNGKGLITAASESSIAIANTQVSGLGTMSTQNANAVAITGGTITGTTVSGMTVSATAGTTMTFPTTNATIARTDAAQTFAGTQTFSSTIAGSINGTAATVTTNANLTGPITSVGNATSVASQTGTGSKFVMDTNPTLVTPTLGVANATSINFGGTALANYVEGTFTPTVTSSGGGTPTYSVQVGTYTRIGNRVLFQLRVVLSSIGTLAAGNVSVAGLPVTSDATSGNNCAIAVQPNGLAATATTEICGVIAAGTQTIAMSKYAAGTTTLLTVADITNTMVLNIAGQYQV